MVGAVQATVALPFATALTLIAVGVLSLAVRVPVMLRAAAQTERAGGVPSTPACHGETP